MIRLDEALFEGCTPVQGKNGSELLNQIGPMNTYENVNDLEVAIESNLAKYEQHVNAVGQLTEFKSVIENLNTNHGLRLCDYQVVKMAYDKIVQPLEIDAPVFPSLEEFRMDGGRLRQTEVALESIGGILKQTAIAVMNFVKNLITQLVKLFQGWLSMNNQYSKRIKDLRTALKQTAGLPQNDEVHVGSFFFQGANRELAAPVVAQYLSLMAQNSNAAISLLDDAAKNFVQANESSNAVKLLTDLSGTFKQSAITLFALTPAEGSDSALIREIKDSTQHLKTFYLSEELAGGNHFYLIDYQNDAQSQDMLDCAMGVVTDPKMATTSGTVPAKGSQELLSYLDLLDNLNQKSIPLRDIINKISVPCVKMIDRINTLSQTDNFFGPNDQVYLQAFKITAMSFLTMFKRTDDFTVKTMQTGLNYVSMSLNNLLTDAAPAQADAPEQTQAQPA